MWTLIVLLNWAANKAPVVVPNFTTEKACIEAAHKVEVAANVPNQGFVCLDMAK